MYVTQISNAAEIDIMFEQQRTNFRSIYACRISSLYTYITLYFATASHKDYMLHTTHVRL